jgi:hypothetical protein
MLNVLVRIQRLFMMTYPDLRPVSGRPPLCPSSIAKVRDEYRNLDRDGVLEKLHGNLKDLSAKNGFLDSAEGCQ